MVTTVKLSQLPSGQSINTASGTGTIENMVIGGVSPQDATFLKVNVSAAPIAGTDLTNKTYVDTIGAGLIPYASSRVATTGALTVTYSNGASGVGATLTNAGVQAALAIDGVTVSTSDRVLVKSQVSTFQNGIYTVTTTGSGATNWVLTRATDFDTASEVKMGAYTPVTEGTSNKGAIFVETGAGPFVIGTTAIIFSDFGSFGTIATQDADNVAITGGTISNVVITNSTINGGVSNEIFVAANGSDISGIGTYLQPYETVQFAIDSILDASSSNRYVVNISGNLTQLGAAALRPWISINGITESSSYLGVENSVGLSDEWDGDGDEITISNCTISAASFVMNLSLSSGTNAIITFDNVKFLDAGIFGISANGRNGAVDKFIFKNCDLSEMINLALNSANFAIYGGIFNNCNFVVDVGTLGDYKGYIYDTICTAPLNYNQYSSGSATTTITTIGSTFTGNWEVIGANAILLTDATSFPGDGFTYTNSGTSQLIDASYAINADYVPTNYSAASTDLKAQLVGIDNALGSGSADAPTNLLFVSNNGDDGTGDGTYVRPYATVSFAAGTISDASTTNRYVINVIGNIEEPADLSLYPWISIATYGSDTVYINVAGEVNLGAGWDVADGNLDITGCVIYAGDGFVIDFTAFPGFAANINAVNSRFVSDSLSNFSASGREGGVDSINFTNSVLDSFGDVFLSSINSFVQGGHFENLSTINFSQATGIGGQFALYMINALYPEIAVEVNDGGEEATVTLVGCIGATISATGVGAAVVLDATSYPAGGLTLNSGATATFMDAATHISAIPDGVISDATTVQGVLDDLIDYDLNRGYASNNETLSGEIDGVNTVFTSAHDIIDDGTEVLYWNGIAVPRDAAYYSITGADEITVTSAPATPMGPLIASVLTLSYNYTS